MREVVPYRMVRTIIQVTTRHGKGKKCLKSCKTSLLLTTMRSATLMNSYEQSIPAIAPQAGFSVLNL